MMTQHKNFKTISGETQNYNLFKETIKKSIYISWFYLFKQEPLHMRAKGG